MVRRWKRWTAVGLPVVLMTGLVLGRLAPVSSAQTEIRVMDREGPYEKDIDVGKKGLSPGDLTLESHPLFDAADGTTVVGRDFEHLTVLRVVAGGQDLDFLFDSTLRFGDGDIVVYGEARFSHVFTPAGITFPVIGGTGAYVGARGTATYSATQNEGEFLIVVDLAG